MTKRKGVLTYTPPGGAPIVIGQAEIDNETGLVTAAIDAQIIKKNEE